MKTCQYCGGKTPRGDIPTCCDEKMLAYKNAIEKYAVVHERQTAIRAANRKAKDLVLKKYDNEIDVLTHYFYYLK